MTEQELLQVPEELREAEERDTSDVPIEEVVRRVATMEAWDNYAS